MTAWQDRPVTAQEAADPRGALFAVADAWADGPKDPEERLLVIAKQNGVHGNARTCAWAIALSAEVLRRGGRRGPPQKSNTCEAGQGYAIIMPGNIWRLPAVATSSKRPSSGWLFGLLAVYAAYRVIR